MPVVGLQCRYDYLRREGNFERSAGLQVGVDTIEVKKKVLLDIRINCL